MQTVFLSGYFARRMTRCIAELMSVRARALILMFSLAFFAAAAQARATEPLISDVAVQRLEGAIQRYQKLVNQGGWPGVDAGPRLEPGDKDKRILQVRARLAVTSNAESGVPDNALLYDPMLELVVRQFQQAHGILADGLIGPKTIAAMSVPAQARLLQLQASLRRTKQLLADLPAKQYVLVNIPGYELQAVRNAAVELDSAVVIGRADRPTPEMQARLTAVNFFPTWHVPASIVKKDLFPRLRVDPEHFTRQDYRIIRQKDGQEIPPQAVREQGLRPQDIRMIRAPGAHNPLGRIRLDMPNRDAIYLHDSPASALFMRADRSFSAGCIRVARVVELSAWLLGEELSGPDAPVSKALREHTPVTMKLPQAVPVHLVYITAWVDESGAVQFREDVYHHAV